MGDKHRRKGAFGVLVVLCLPRSVDQRTQSDKKSNPIAGSAGTEYEVVLRAAVARMLETQCRRCDQELVVDMPEPVDHRNRILMAPRTVAVPGVEDSMVAGAGPADVTAVTPTDACAEIFNIGLSASHAVKMSSFTSDGNSKPGNPAVPVNRFSDIAPDSALALSVILTVPALTPLTGLPLSVSVTTGAGAIASLTVALQGAGW